MEVRIKRVRDCCIYFTRSALYMLSVLGNQTYDNFWHPSVSNCISSCQGQVLRKMKYWWGWLRDNVGGRFMILMLMAMRPFAFLHYRSLALLTNSLPSAWENAYCLRSECFGFMCFLPFVSCRHWGGTRRRQMTKWWWWHRKKDGEVVVVAPGWDKTKTDDKVMVVAQGKEMVKWWWWRRR